MVGRPLQARIVAHKAGHALHTQLVTRLLEDRSLWKETTEARAPGSSSDHVSSSEPIDAGIPAD